MNVRFDKQYNALYMRSRVGSIKLFARDNSGKRAEIDILQSCVP